MTPPKLSMCVRYIKCKLSLILIERVDIEQYMSAMTYKPNVLRFWMKMR
jgi:hypothetical protein